MLLTWRAKDTLTTGEENVDCSAHIFTAWMMAATSCSRLEAQHKSRIAPAATCALGINSTGSKVEARPRRWSI